MWEINAAQSDRLLDRPDAGELTLFGRSNISPFSVRAQRLLKEQIGYLFQNFALLENKSVRYNLQIIMERKMSRQTRDQKIREALSAVGSMDLRISWSVSVPEGNSSGSLSLACC